MVYSHFLFMSKNNTIKKSDKKFIRREKARIRGLFLDVKKQEEMINELYKKFSTVSVPLSVIASEAKQSNSANKEIASSPKAPRNDGVAKKPKIKKEKLVKAKTQ